MEKYIVVYTEGETDEEFYDRVLETIKSKMPDQKFKIEKLKKNCITGIAKFQKKLVNKFIKEVAKPYSKKYEIVVFLCYDTDVFEFGKHPPVDRKKLEKDLLNAGASKVIHIKANRTIEDFFMYDIDGIVDFLKIKKPKNLKGSNGLEKLEKLFANANRIYQKGHKCAGFVDSLNMDVIFPNICKDIKPLCIELGMNEPCSSCKKLVKKKNK